MGDVSKLPKWAQDKIKLLEMRLTELTNNFNEVLGLKATRVTTRNPVRILGERVFVRDDTYRFHLSSHPDAWADVGFDNHGQLLVRAVNRLVVLPESSNLIQLRTE